MTDKTKARDFSEIPGGSTFYRKVGGCIAVMVKANDEQAVLVEDAPASMQGLPTRWWKIPPMELMVGQTRFEEFEKAHPDRVVRSADHPLLSTDG